MRKNLIVAAMLLSAIAANGQTDGPEFKACPSKYNTIQFLDSVFYLGEAIAKNFEKSQAYINYSLITNDLLILTAEGRIAKIPNLTKYMQITYGGRSFVPIDAHCLGEAIKTFSNGMVLLLERKTIQKSGTKGAYGTTTETTSVTKITHLEDDGGRYIPINTKLEDEYRFTNRFHLLINGKIKPITTTKRLKKIFPDKAQVIDDELKKEVDNESDIDRYIRIITACCE